MSKIRTMKSDGKIPFDIHPVVFFASVALIFTFVLIAIFAPGAEDFFESLRDWMTANTGWLFVLTMNVVLIFVVGLMPGKIGDIRLGGKDARPEFSTSGWFAMLFSAGMGIGLLFYGVAEPMTHYGAPPTADPETAEAARESMQFVFLHWGFHAWGIYALVGLALCFFAYNRNLPLSVRTVFYPLLGDKVYGRAGDAVDTLSTVATMFGVATSLGVGVQQINAGLSFLSQRFLPFDIPEAAWVQILLIVVVTGFATISVVKGLDGGIQVVSRINIYLAMALLVFVLIAGPTIYIADGVVQNIGAYLQKLPQTAMWSEAYSGTEWQHGWTIFYYAWWISWSPFVGMFIARVSKGRTVREFIGGVLVVPTFVTFIWMGVFGNAALWLEMEQGAGLAAAVAENMPVSLFVFFDELPLTAITSTLGVLVVVSFFVTSSDSGSLVIDMITAGGNPDPPTPQRVFWAVTEGLVAGALMIGGGLAALQAAAIVTGLPFAVVLLLMAWSLLKGLRAEVAEEEFESPEPPPKRRTDAAAAPAE